MAYIRNSLSLILILALFRCAPVPQAPDAVKPPVINPHLDPCVMLVEAGDYTAAIPECSAAADFDPQDFTARSYLARAHAGAGNQTRAITEFQSAIRLDPQSIKARMDLGDLLLSASRPAEAAEQYRKVAEMKPDFPDAAGKLAQCLMEMKNWSEADHWLLKAIDLAPDRDDLPVLRIQYLVRAGRPQQALDYARSARSRWPASERIRDASIELLYSQSVAALQSKQLDSAWKLTDELLIIEPGSARAFMLRGRIHRERGNLDEAIAMFRKASAANPTDSTAFVHIGNVYRMKGDNDQAIEAYRSALRIDPDDVEAKANLKQLIGAPRSRR